MADGKTHAQSNLIAGLLMTGASVWIPLPIEQIIGIAVGSFLGGIITPDLDIAYRTYEKNRVYRFNPTLGGLWHLYWFPYGWLMRHRGLSHWLFLGTLTRAVYLILPFFLLYLYFFWWYPLGCNQNAWWCMQNSWMNLTNSATAPFFRLPPAVYYAFGAWVIQDIVHILLDQVWSWLDLPYEYR